MMSGVDQTLFGRHRRRHLVPQRHQEPDRDRPGVVFHLRQYRPGPDARGGELISPGSRSTRLKLRADYTYTEAEDADLHQELVRRPKNKISAEARWQAMEALALDATLLYVGRWIDGSRDFSVSRLNAHPYRDRRYCGVLRPDRSFHLDGAGRVICSTEPIRTRSDSCSPAGPSMPASRRATE